MFEVGEDMGKKHDQSNPPGQQKFVVRVSNSNLSIFKFKKYINITDSKSKSKFIKFLDRSLKLRGFLSSPTTQA